MTPEMNFYFYVKTHNIHIYNNYITFSFGSV